MAERERRTPFLFGHGIEHVFARRQADHLQVAQIAAEGLAQRLALALQQRVACGIAALPKRGERIEPVGDI